MPSIPTLSKRIQAAFAYDFVDGPAFVWSPADRRITTPKITTEADLWDLLHEIAHGELHHTSYTLDIELVGRETQAWDHAASVLAPQFGLRINQNHIEDTLDTYREWLHKRSTCPDCGQTGLQTKNTYSCINCKCLWRANEARICGLRRIRLPNRSLIS